MLHSLLCEAEAMKRRREATKVNTPVTTRKNVKTSTTEETKTNEPPPKKRQSTRLQKQQVSHAPEVTKQEETSRASQQLQVYVNQASSSDSTLGPAETPIFDDALGYIQQIKEQFHSTPDVYTSFLEIMKDFKVGTINTDVVIQRVKTLFKGYNSLTLGFNQFLPVNLRIKEEELGPSTLPPTPISAQAAKSKPQLAREFNHAVQFVSKVKQRFIDQPEVYQNFLEILYDYRSKLTPNDVQGRINQLFASHQDLLYEFNFFLNADRKNENATEPKKSAKSAARRTKPSS